MDRELSKSGDATHFATDGPAPRRYDGHTTAARVRVAVFVRSEKSNALVGGGVPRFRRAGQLRVHTPYEEWCIFHTSKWPLDVRSSTT